MLMARSSIFIWLTNLGQVYIEFWNIYDAYTCAYIYAYINANCFQNDYRFSCKEQVLFNILFVMLFMLPKTTVSYTCTVPEKCIGHSDNIWLKLTGWLNQAICILLVIIRFVHLLIKKFVQPKTGFKVHKSMETQSKTVVPSFSAL